MVKQSLILALFALVLGSCMRHSPEGLPKFKEQFKTQIASFEKQKEKADNHVVKGLEGISALQEALNDARKIDKEFNKVYGDWEKVNKRVDALNREYEELKQRAENLFGAIERQVESLNDPKTKSELMAALKKSRSKYEGTLENTAKAIAKLRNLHREAVDIVKALEAAVAIGQIDNINNSLQNIETRVGDVMKELNATVEESKKLYEKRIGDIS